MLPTANNLRASFDSEQLAVARALTSPREFVKLGDIFAVRAKFQKEFLQN